MDRSVYSVKALAFNELELEKQFLSLAISKDDLRMVVVDVEEAKCLYIEEFALNSQEEIVAQLKEIYANHPFLQAGYWNKVRVAFSDTLYTLIPHKLYDETQNLESYLNLQSVSSDSKAVLKAEQIKVDAVNIFQVSQNLINFFQEAYPQCDLDFTHTSQLCIDAVLKHFSNNEGVHVFAMRSQLMIVYIKGNLLEFCNTFTHKSIEDFLYYILLVLDERNLSNKKVDVFMYGKFNKDTRVYNLLKKYIKNLKFVEEKPKWLKFDSNFIEMPTHTYFDLFGFNITKPRILL